MGTKIHLECTLEISELEKIIKQIKELNRVDFNERNVVIRRDDKGIKYIYTDYKKDGEKLVSIANGKGYFLI